MSRAIDKQLDLIEKQYGLTPDGRAWLIAACDPFHDEDIRIAGYPDLTTVGSVVQLVKLQLQVSVPTTGAGVVAANANWDANISLFPSAVTQSVSENITLNQFGQVTATTGSTPVQVGGLVVSACPQGLQTWPDATLLTLPPVTTQALGCSQFIKGNCRIIGMGFEVVNTTADIYRQGQVTAYRMPTQRTPSVIYNSYTTTPAITAAYPVLINRFPPGTLADAQLLYGSRSWLASEGGYCVSRQNSIDNPLGQPQWSTQAYTGCDIAATFVSNYLQTDSSFGTTNDYYPDINAPFDLSGLYFTGLSYNTTLTVNVRWLIERVPSPAETDLVVLATPSSAYDPVALQLMGRCMQDMPPGVMLKENSLGSFFRSALSKTSEWAPRIGEFVGNFVPGAHALGQAVGEAAHIGKKLIKKDKKKATNQQREPNKLPSSASTTAMPKRAQ
jgi:hypothetical protein